VISFDSDSRSPGHDSPGQQELYEWLGHYIDSHRHRPLDPPDDGGDGLRSPAPRSEPQRGHLQQKGWITWQEAPGPQTCSCWVRHHPGIPMLGTWRLARRWWSPSIDIPGGRSILPAPARYPRPVALTVNGTALIAAHIDAGDVSDGAVNEPSRSRPHDRGRPWWRAGGTRSKQSPARAMVRLESRQTPLCARC